MQIYKLNGDNYSSWSIQMKSLLITLDYWSVCETICPSTASELIHIKNCRTAMGAWEKLSSIYMAKSPARKVHLFKKLVRFKILDGQPYAQQINDFSGLVESLKEIDSSMTEDFISIVLLCSLPDSFDSFVVAMESRDKLPTYEQFKVKILEERNHRGERQQPGEEHVLAIKYRTEKDIKSTVGNTHMVRVIERRT